MTKKHKKHHKKHIHHKKRRNDLQYKKFNGYYKYDNYLYIKKYCENCGFETNDKQIKPKKDFEGKFRCIACNSILKTRKI